MLNTSNAIAEIKPILKVYMRGTLAKPTQTSTLHYPEIVGLSFRFVPARPFIWTLHILNIFTLCDVVNHALPWFFCQLQLLSLLSKDAVQTFPVPFGV